MRRLYLAFACYALYAARAGGQTTTSARRGSPSGADILPILAERIDVQKQGVGIVVGVIDSHGRRIVAYGAPEKGDKRPLNGDTLFEIGSLPKAFPPPLPAELAPPGGLLPDHH